MIADGDSVAKNAFRVGLRVDTPLPTVAAGNGTQELDACDILEVQDMAEAIARAERPMKLARSARDMFESLGTRPAGTAGAWRATDDTAGPAIAAPPLTPIPPPMYLTVPSLHIPLDAAPPPEDDAFFQPAGRLRTLADATLENYRPEPTLLVRARSRRRGYSWVIVAVLLPLVVLAGFEISSRAGAATTVAAAATVIPTVTPAVAAPPAATAIPAIPAIPATATPATPATAATASSTKAKAKGGVPVFDVNSLPPAPGARTKPHAR